MSQFKFLHAADLHLDVPMKHIKHISALKDTTFKALNNLVECAKKEKVDALLLAGDTWNSEDASLKARFALKKACEELQNNNIKVYIVHGNHDPIDEVFQSMSFPENVFFFNEEYESIVFEKNNETIAYIHGISHETDKETRNLSTNFKKISEKEKKEAFHVGLFHTSLNNSEDGALYAPCSVSELVEKNMHYFALGHVHTHKMLNENPHIAYSGSLQGLHINEKNEHGCYCVTLQRDEKTKNVEIESTFISLAPLIWKEVNYTIEDFATIENSEDAENQERKNTVDLLSIHSNLYDIFEEIAHSMPKNVSYILARLKLEGKTDLNSKLRNSYILQEFLDNLNDELAHLSPKVTIKDIIIETSESADNISIAEILAEDTFLAKTLQEAESLLAANSSEILEYAYNLYQESPIQKQYKRILPPIDNEEVLKEIITKAQYICMQSMES